MHDIKFIRENPQEFDKQLDRKGFPATATKIIELDSEFRLLQTKLDELRTKKNQIAKQIGQAKANKQDASDLFKQAEIVKKQISEIEDSGDKELKDLLLTLPNLANPQVPSGTSENDNIEIKKWGEPKEFDFKPKQHFEIGDKIGLDFEQSAKISGARFSTFTGDLAKLARALQNFMLDLHTTEHGFTEIHTPSLVKAEALIGTGQLPKFEEDLFKTTDGRYLISTSEISVTNMVAGKLLKEQDLPIRYACYGRCFRSEAGSAGKDTRGIIRQHEFSKVELVSIVKSEDSEKEHQKILQSAEAVLQKLVLPYRIVDLCTGDLGFSSARTFDIEVWLAGQNSYREISSVSNFRDFQARRMKTRYKDLQGKNQFTNTLNGSGVALERLIVAILENYQQKDGSIKIPEVLINYMSGVTEIGNSKV